MSDDDAARTEEDSVVRVRFAECDLVRGLDIWLQQCIGAIELDYPRLIVLNRKWSSLLDLLGLGLLFPSMNRLPCVLFRRRIYHPWSVCHDDWLVLVRPWKEEVRRSKECGREEDIASGIL